MRDWLRPLHEALDNKSDPVDFFFRDDAGWGDAELFKLLDIFADHDLPMDLAAIPMALSRALVAELSRHRALSSNCARIHQHGFAHTNHEPVGRKCEFGAAREFESQRRDIERGQQRLQDMFGSLLDPIFTPPWNRCTEVTGKSLVALGVSVLSRESSAAPLKVDGLFELPIHIDWFAHHKGHRLTRSEWTNLLADKISTYAAVGIMFHHAVMDGFEFGATIELLEALALHPKVRTSNMAPLALRGATTAASIAVNHSALTSPCRLALTQG